MLAIADLQLCTLGGNAHSLRNHASRSVRVYESLIHASDTHVSAVELLTTSRGNMQALAPTQCRFCTGSRLQHAPRPQHVVYSTRAVAQRAATKAADFRRLTNEEIDQEVQDAKASLFLEFRVPQKRSQVAINLSYYSHHAPNSA